MKGKMSRLPWFVGRCCSVLGHPLCMLCTLLIECCPEPLFYKRFIHFAHHQVRVRLWDDFCDESWPSKFRYRYPDYRGDTG